MPETQWMTLLETADLMKRLPVQVTRMCEDGKLEYYKEDGRYFVSRESIDLFMRPTTGGTAETDPDSNGTPRRKYGRAPEDIEPSTETATEPATVNGRDGTNAVEAVETGDIMAEATGYGVAGVDRDLEATPETAAANAEAENALGHDDDAATTAEAENALGQDDDDAATAEAENALGHDDDDPEATAKADTALGHDDDDPEATAKADTALGHDDEDAVPGEDEGPANAADDAEETPVNDYETVNPDDDAVAEEDGERAPSAMDPDDSGAKAAEILADLRAALARHALEHRAFCDEIAGLADALESTLSRGGDKTSELTREISSLLARYSRR